MTWWVDLRDPRHVVGERGFVARTSPEHAALIAAAPELLEVARLILDTAADTTPPDLLARASSAVAKAQEVYE